jgi:hypothetical protein
LRRVTLGDVRSFGQDKDPKAANQTPADPFLDKKMRTDSVEPVLVSPVLHPEKGLRPQFLSGADILDRVANSHAISPVSHSRHDTIPKA